MKTTLLAWVAACVLVFAMTPAWAGLAPEEKAKAEGLIRQFTAAEFETRQKAVDALVAMGAGVAPMVKETQAGTKDAEVKLRCEMVLKALREKFPDSIGTVDGPAAAATGTKQPAFDASKVTVDLKDAPLSEALEALAQQSGNAKLDAKGFKDRPVTLTVKDMPYWQALDRAIEQAGLLYSLPWYHGAPSMLLQSRSKEPAIAAYAGPAALWVDHVTRTTTQMKSYATRTDPAGAWAPTQRSLSVSMRLAVEDRLNAGGCGIRWTKATADGKDVLPKYYAATPTTGASQQLQIVDTEEGLKGPLALEGFIQVKFYVGATERRADDIFAAKKTAGDEELLLRDVFAFRQDKFVQVSLLLQGDASRTKLATWDMPTGYGFALVDPNGKRYAHSGWSSTGTNITLSFPNVPEVEGKWSLVLVIPKTIEAKEYPFTLKDVPLP